MTVDAIQFLKEEHRRAKAAFDKIEGASTHNRIALWHDLKPELEVHERIERSCLYEPLAHDARGRDTTLIEWNPHHEEQVQKVEVLLREVGGLDARDERWLTKIKEIRQMLEAHIRQEETEIFPRVALVWNRDRLDRAGADLERMKKEASRQAA